MAGAYTCLEANMQVSYSLLETVKAHYIKEEIARCSNGPSRAGKVGWIIYLLLIPLKPFVMTVHLGQRWSHIQLIDISYL